MSDTPSQSEPATGAPKQNSRTIWVIFLVLAGAYILFSLPESSAIKWGTDLDKGLEQAAEKNQFALVMFSASWCEPCKQMSQQVLSKEQVRNSLKNWVLIKIDTDKQKSVKQAYIVNGLPTFIIFSPKGDKIKRFEGTMPKEEFIKIIKSAEKEIQ